MEKPEKFTCKNQENEIVGYIYGKGYCIKPAIILSHGFNGSQKHHKKLVSQLVDMGYIVFTFDFPGGSRHSMSSGDSKKMTVFSEKMDLIHVFRYVESCQFVNKRQISLMGFSMGGLVSMLVAKELTDKIASLIVFYPATNLPDQMRKGKFLSYRFNPDDVPNILGRHPMVLGGNFAKSLQRIDIKKEIGGYAGLGIIIQGTKDKIVPVEYAREANKLYPHIYYLEIEKAGHNFKGAYLREAMTYVKSFLAPVSEK